MATSREFYYIRTIDSHAIHEAIETFSNVNKVPARDLKSHCRERELVETRCMIWAYLREHTTLSFNGLGKLFNKHHSTVIAGIKAHKKHTELFSNGRRVNEMYTKKFLEGSQILSQVMGERKELAKDLRYRVVLYTDDPDKLENIEILSVKDMTLKEFLI